MPRKTRRTAELQRVAAPYGGGRGVLSGRGFEKRKGREKRNGKTPRSATMKQSKFIKSRRTKMSRPDRSPTPAACGSTIAVLLELCGAGATGISGSLVQSRSIAVWQIARRSLAQDHHNSQKTPDAFGAASAGAACSLIAPERGSVPPPLLPCLAQPQPQSSVIREPGWHGLSLANHQAFLLHADAVAAEIPGQVGRSPGCLTGLTDGG